MSVKVLGARNIDMNKHTPNQNLLSNNHINYVDYHVSNIESYKAISEDKGELQGIKSHCHGHCLILRIYNRSSTSKKLIKCFLINE